MKLNEDYMLLIL